jgi:hypothetical protein
MRRRGSGDRHARSASASLRAASARARRGALLALAPLTFALMFALTSLDAGLRTRKSAYGIVSRIRGRPRARRLHAGGPGSQGAAPLPSACASLRLLCCLRYRPRAAVRSRSRPRARAARSRLAAPGAALAWGQLSPAAWMPSRTWRFLRVLGGSSQDAWSAPRRGLRAACVRPAAGLAYRPRSASRVSWGGQRPGSAGFWERLLAALRWPAPARALR